jgi:hypothetical protein
MSDTVQPVWLLLVNNIAAPNAAPSAPDHGQPTPQNCRGEYLHVAVKRTSTATVSLWGWARAMNEWFLLETWSMTGTQSSAEPAPGAAAYDRLYIQISVIGAGNVSAWIGWSSEV